MKIGVIIPAYNAERYAAECLDSLLAQTYAEWEAYIMDDGSTDNTLSILRDYAQRDARFRVWHQENKGLVGTMNALLDRLDTSIELIAFLDIDDFIHPQMFSSLCEVLNRTGSDVAECSIRHVSADATAAKTFSDCLPASSERLIDDMSIYWLHRTSPDGWINKQNKLYRRKAIGNLRFQPTLSYEDDYFFACEVNANISRKVKIDAELYAYRATPNSSTASIPFSKYVQATLERIRLSFAVFLNAGRVPKALEAGFRADLAKDAYRMCIRKNLKKNTDRRLRRELFALAGEAFKRLEKEHHFSPIGLNPIQKLVYKSCRSGHYLVARLLVAFT